MKFNILVVIFGLCALNIKAQGLKVTYSLFEIQNEQYVEIKGLHFELIINNGKSFFSSHKSMDIDINNRYSVIIRQLTAGNYYVDINEKINLSVGEIFNKKYLIEEDFENKWIILDEYKTILGFKTRKAIRNVEHDRLKKTFTTEVWFAQELEFNFGPYDVYNLPGLVLGFKAKNNNFITLATKVETYNDEIKLPKGKRISSDELEKEMIKFMNK